MAHSLSFSLPQLPSSKFNTNTFSINPTPISTHLKTPTIFTSTSKKHNSFTISPKATQDSNNNNNNTEQENPPPENNENNQEAEDVGSEIKKLMKEREEKGGGFLSGVAEEIREIEWPVFGKVLSTTGVVIGVIAGSSVVLLTLNAVLAELSDGLFAGKGVQDFFS